jgi:hypothetical protein
MGRCLAAQIFFGHSLARTEGVFHFKWVPWFCFGMYWLMFSPRQAGKSLRAFLKEPRTIAGLALLAAAAVGFGFF